ncbi:CoA-disulfide reductase [Candidatus Hepatincolaceae symbiont of Richtersius coronifer]
MEQNNKEVRVIIIGGQAAGMTCAAKINRAKEDYDIKIFEKTNTISFGACGLPYYVADYFSDESTLCARTKEEVENTNFHVYLKHKVLSIDHINKFVQVKNLTNKRITNYPYDKLVLATGALPNALPPSIQASNVQGVYSFKNLHEVKIIKRNLQEKTAKSILVLGAGYIGLEILEALSKYPDVQVTVIDQKEKITMGLIDKEFEPLLLEELKKYKINLLLRSKILKIENLGKKVIATYECKEGDKLSCKTIEADIIISALGFRPQVELFENINFDKLPNGALIVNNNGETNIPDIYAAGDCAAVYNKLLKVNQYIPLATLANKLGRAIADAISGNKDTFQGALSSYCIKVLNLEIGRTGISEEEAMLHKIPYVVSFVQDYDHTSYYPHQNKLYIKLIICPIEFVIIGAQILGASGAILRAHSLSIFIDQKVSAVEIGMMDLAYSPPFSRTWDILNIAGNVAQKEIKKLQQSMEYDYRKMI